MIPYQVNDENKGTCPTKFIEYCAMGKPIVRQAFQALKSSMILPSSQIHPMNLQG